ncbi:hypothetical protein IAD21_02883 [Abditibacteriota bacterium]|nr:hypothetical protein IAD21_02883 [Abditibacteriota bacterium]
MLSFLPSQLLSKRDALRWFQVALVTTVGVLSTLGSAQAQNTAPVTPSGAPPAGARILNQADASYVTQGYTERISSNAVRLFISPVEALTLVQPNSRRLAPGSPVALPHRLTNTGNVTTSYSLTTTNATGDDYDLLGLKLVRDVNSNGIADAGEPAFGPSDTITLAPGEGADFLILGQVPPDARPETGANVQITARSSTQNSSVSNIDRVIVSPGPAVSVRKAATPDKATRGQLVTWAITANSNGAVSPDPIAVTVNGAPRSFVILRDTVPANTSFVEVVGTPDARATVLYHRTGDALQAYTSLPNAPVDALAWGLTTFAPGTTLRANFSVRVNANASGPINNIALFYFRSTGSNGTGGTGGVDTDVATPSNPVEVGVPLAPPTLTYYTDGTFSRVARVTSIGRNLFLQGEDSACNGDPQVVEHVQITIRSAKTGDTIQVGATETGPNTGTFRVDNSVKTSGTAAVAGDDVLQIAVNDQLTARLGGCGTADAVTDILVDPLGVVFDSRTGAPIAGASVTIVDAATGQPARVFDFDGVTPRLSTVVTGADGGFQFPAVAPGTYRLVVVPPQGYTAPSKLLPANQPANRIIDPSGSYGGSFTVPVNGFVRLDFPLDPPQGPGLFLQKEALTRDAEVGGTVEYVLTLKNVAGVQLNNVEVRDVLPRGFSFVVGTARRDAVAPETSAVKLTDPTTAPDRTLIFAIGNVAKDGQLVIRYRTRIGAGATEGRALNRARATGTTPQQTFTSNEATAEVNVRGGVFTTRGILIGKVWVDTNQNAKQDKDESPVPGVRVFLENGNYAVTDRDGKYSIYGLLPITHIVKLDTATLPAGAKLESLTVMHAGSGKTAFADLKNGEMQKVDFAVVDASDDILENIAKRVKAGDPSVPEVDSRLRSDLNVAPTVVRSTDLVNRSGPASGTISGQGAVPSGVTPPLQPEITTGGTPSEARTGDERDGAQTPVVAPATIDSLPRRTASDGPLDGSFAAAPAPSLPAATETLEEQVQKATDGKLEILGLSDGDLLASDNINVRVKGTAGAGIKLYLNGEEQSEKRIGTQSTDEARGIVGLEWIALKLKPGANELRATQVDGFGNVRGEVKLSVTVAGSAGQIALVLPGNGAPADGLTPVTVGVKIFDAGGNRVSARTFLTLEATAGRWNVTDLNPNEPGVQVALEGGQGTFQLLPPDVPARGVVRISAGLLQSEGEISFTPFLRPVLAAGIVETQIGFGGGRGIPTGAFERTLQRVGSNNIGARGAVYLKGSIEGKYLLSMRYDTQNDEDRRLFRDIQPDEFYPVYGDSSLKGFDAQSTSQLYVRVDKDNSFALYGDFSPFSARSGASSDSNSLSRYSRALTGVQAHGENKSYSATTFYARQSTTRRVYELRGNGTSGPYALPDTQIRPQSETVQIITRDRNNPGVVLNVREQTRFSDYTFDGFLTGLLFRASVPSFDQDGNPVFIRVTYELDAGGPAYSVYGGLLQGKLSNNLQVGASFVSDQNPDNGADIYGANAAYRLSRTTVLIGEYAHSKGGLITGGNTTATSGSAARVELRHDGKNLQVRAFAGRATAGFSNAESVLSSGRSEQGVRLSYRLSPRTAISAEAISTKEITSGAKTMGAQLAVDQSLGRDVRASVGIRTGKGDASATLGGTGTDNVDFTSVFARLNARVPGVPKANVFLRGEQTLNGGSRSLAVGGDYQIAARTRLYASHEFFDSPLSLYALGDTERRYGTRVGVETQYARGASLFSEYRLAGGIDGRSAEAAIGLRNTWHLGDSIGLSTSFETTKRLSAFAAGTGQAFNTGDDGTAISIGLENLKSNILKWTARAERRNGSGTDSTLVNAGFAYAPSRDLTFLGRGAYSSTKSSGGSVVLGSSNRTQTRLQFGAAYRPSKNDRFNMLAKYEYRGGDDPDALSARLRRRVHILSGDMNYGYSRSLLAQLHVAAKRSKDSDEFNASTSAYLISGRLTRDFGRRFSASLLGSTLWSNPGGRQTSFGLEGSYSVTSNLLLSVGYNFSELEDEDLLSDTLGKGLYMRLRWKFDEDLFNGLGAFNKAPAISNAKPFVPVDNGGYGSGVTFDGGTTAALDGLTGTGGTYSAPRLGG